MSVTLSGVSPAFQTFMTEAPEHAQALMAAVRALGGASALDRRTEALASLAVLGALRLEGGVPLLVARAKQAGATRSEVISALLVGLPADGSGVTRTLSAALVAFEGV